MPVFVVLGIVCLVLAACAVGAAVTLSALRAKRIEPLVNMLRASEAETRVKALDAIGDLPPSLRRAVAKSIRKMLAPSARPWDRGVHVRLAYWYLRQTFALLADARPRVRSDGARLLQAVLRHIMPTAETEDEVSEQPLSKPAFALVEMGAGRTFMRSARDPGLKVMAFAELMEAGILKPTVTGQKERALDQLMSEAIVPLGSAAKDMNVQVRRGVIELLGAVGTTETAPLLEASLADPSSEVRAEAARGLAKLGAADAVPSLVELLRDPVIEVQAASAWALAELGATTACAAILDALAKACLRYPVTHSAIEEMIAASARLAESVPVAFERAMRVLPRPAAEKLSQALESSGVVSRWLALAWDEERDGETIRSLLMMLSRSGVRAPFRQALEATEASVRMRAALVIGRCGEPSSVDMLGPLARDADLQVRTAAIEALGSVAQPQSCAVIAGCIDDPEADARRACVSALENIARTARAWLDGTSPVDAQLLREAIESAGRAIRHAAYDRDEGVRTAVAKALAAAADDEGNPPAGGLLVELALHDESEAVRQAARSSLRETKPVALEPVVLAAASDADPALRARALYLLAILNGRRVAWRLVEALNDTVTSVKDAALRCLGEIDWSQAAGRLVTHLRSPDQPIRAGVALLMSAPAGAGYLSQLADCLTDPDEMVRACAIDSLAAHGDAASPYRHAISQRLRDPSPIARERAMAALSHLGEPPAAERLIVGLSDPDPAVRLRNAGRLLEMAAAGSFDALARAVDNPEAVGAIAESLVGQGSQRGRAFAAALLAAPRAERTRMIAALSQALLQVGAFEVWLEGLSHVDPQVREEAAEAIGLLREPRAAGSLALALEKDPCPSVRQAAARALGEIGSESAVAVLLAAEQEDPDPLLRSLAGGIAQVVMQRAVSASPQLPTDRQI